MEATGCLLSEAFGEVEEIKIKKKSKKEKKKSGILYPDDLKPVDSNYQDDMYSEEGIEYQKKLLLRSIDF